MSDLLGNPEDRFSHNKAQICFTESTDTMLLNKSNNVFSCFQSQFLINLGIALVSILFSFSVLRIQYTYSGELTKACLLHNVDSAYMEPYEIRMH